MIPVVVFCRALSCLIEIRREWQRRFLLAIGSFLLIYMVIFTGDPVNFTCAILFFLFCMWAACKGTGLKRFTVGLMLASTILALNGLFDNCISYFLPNHYGRLHDLQYLAFRHASTLFLYLCIRHYRPGRDFELSPSLWRLILMLCFPPLGIVFSRACPLRYGRCKYRLIYSPVFCGSICICRNYPGSICPQQAPEA